MSDVKATTLMGQSGHGRHLQLDKATSTDRGANEAVKQRYHVPTMPNRYLKPARSNLEMDGTENRHIDGIEPKRLVRQPSDTSFQTVPSSSPQHHSGPKESINFPESPRVLHKNSKYNPYVSNQEMDSRSRRHGQATAKRLFDPDFHDPIQFQKRSSERSGTSPDHQASPRDLAGSHHDQRRQGQIPSHQESSIIEPTSRQASHQEPSTELARTKRDQGEVKSQQHHLEALAADKARERRRRREGSEKGSLGASSHKKKDEERSKGSRSSEGSESLKDRDRGRGKK